MTVVVEKAHAKINLGLKILGKRCDGFHNILSIFQTVNVYDTLLVSDSETPGLICDAPEVPLGDDNLILRAEKVFLEFTGIDSRSHFHLTKKIPMGGGLGGGSADAAATLRGLKNLYHAETLSDMTIAEMSAKLGSDVPFLLREGTAVVSGRGENIFNVDWPFDFTYVIVYPGFAISTKWAYNSLRKYSDNCCTYQDMVTHLREGKMEKVEFFKELVNDFELIVLLEYPIVSEIKSIMLANGATAAVLTGSGSSMAGIFEDEQEALKCSKILDIKGWRIFTAKKSS
jgi:4-diphosphocytidyl-2-C-methyl-D-erythritol kinase